MSADDGASDSEDPGSCKNTVYLILTDAIRKNGSRLDATSFGLVNKTLKNWAKYKPNWVPSAATLEDIVVSPGFKWLALEGQAVILRLWLRRAAASASRCSPASHRFVCAITLITENAPEEIWESFPQKLAA